MNRHVTRDHDSCRVQLQKHLVDTGYVLVGEVRRLTGECRLSADSKKYLTMRLRFKNIIIEGNKKLAGQIKTRGGFGVIAVSNIQQALEIIFRDV